MIKLYEKCSYLTKNVTKVTSCTEINDEYYITLEESIFFPEEGGQKADTGKLTEEGGREIELLDGQLLKGLSKEAANLLADTSKELVAEGQLPSEMIFYKVSAKVLKGTEVECSIDMAKRFDRMQNHSGEHVLTGVIHNKYGFDNVGFHLSDDGPVTLDINGVLTYEQVMEMEKEANRVVYANMPIVDTYPSKDELINMTYRSKIDIEGQVRLITIGNEQEIIDICACCAPHVKQTGEIGIIKVISVINWKGGIRISMLAGRRALEYCNGEHEIIKKLTGLLTTSAENIVGITEAHIAEIGLLKSKLATSLEANVISKIDNDIMSVPQKAAVISSGDCLPFGHVEFVDGDFPVASMKNIYNYLLTKYKGYVAVLAGDDENGYRYFGGIADGDSRELATALRETFNAKGGGKQDMVQGQIVASKEEIKAVVMGL